MGETDLEHDEIEQTNPKHHKWKKSEHVSPFSLKRKMRREEKRREESEVKSLRHSRHCTYLLTACEVGMPMLLRN